VARCPTPSPGARKHATDDRETHVAVPQLLTPSVTVGVLSRLAPKLTPETVTL
jgi:hypothetical protein